ncbi:SHQ1 protein-domain-containing protein [Suillus clintonianus]|uniref:SHQ1 protein-domain-containing protein n=1 Tax=Suillus clintonianus TaxID=1904413 RepID=UPI001B881F7D|nr:SHQ1 protein-domain-containing protein [Suillus clintonianus]KAG2157427.1 SHQ1 protein-domain-containing protein [Suillus clintonianus]
MITPRFYCTQTLESVAVSVYCPSVRASDVEINIDETLLTVHINPYFLRINFPHPVLEDDQSSATYDPSSGYLTVTLTKETKGQEFPDLDLLAKLLAPRHVEVPKQPTIEVIESETSPQSELEELVDLTSAISLEQRDILQAAENDWQFPQTVAESPLQLSTKRYYGFLDMYTGYFTHVAHTENDVNELGSEAESCLPEERRAKRLQHEEMKWDEEHYMADYVDDEYIQELIAWEDRELAHAECIFTESENMTMLNLPRKEYLPTTSQQRALYLTLLTLLFAYAYDRRTTQHDPTPESAWTICSLVPAFSALDPPRYIASESVPLSISTSGFTDDDLASALMPSYRRSLAFPLYRSFAMADACRNDVAAILAKGKRMVTRYILEMKHILDHHEVYYVYSKIWVDDFLVWIQASASDEIMLDIAEQLKALTITKTMIGWNIEKLEAATLLDTSDSDNESSE